MSSLNPRKAVLDMAPYSPPTGNRHDKLRLDFNENTIGCSPKVIEHLREHLTAGRLSIYPEYADAIRELADFFGVSSDEFTLTNGTDEAIQLLINTYVEDGDDVVTLKPSYAMYRFYSELAGAKVLEPRYGAEMEFPWEQVLSALAAGPKLFFLPNPNSPTGNLLSHADLRRILKAATRTMVVIDEAQAVPAIAPAHASSG